MSMTIESTPFTLSEDLTPDLCDFLYKLYVELFRAPESFSVYGRYRTLETAAVDVCKWHIDAISVEALRHLVENRTAKGLRRGHRMARKDRGAFLFGQINPLTKAEMLDFFFKHDRVTLVHARENTRNGISHWSEQLHVPPGRLTGGSYSVLVSVDDISWATEMWRQHQAAA